jgi:hypothetical protein
MPAYAQGKIAREDIAQLAVALLESPEAADTTFEVKSTQPFPEPYKADPSAPPRDWRVSVSDMPVPSDRCCNVQHHS